MKKALLITAVVALIATACSTSGEKALVGTPGLPVATDFTVTLVGGGTFTLSKTLSDKPVVINFWASWCPPCRAEMPDIDRVARNTPDVQFIGIAIDDTLSNALAYASSIGIGYPIAIDDNYTLADAYMVSVLPQTWLIDSNGAVVASFTGAVTADQLVDHIEQDLGVKAGS
jgi:thiol-disulfide isomerase/thioredoxin